MCPLWPLHIFLMYLLLLIPLCVVSTAAAVKVADILPFSFSPTDLRMYMDQTKVVNAWSSDPRVNEQDWYIETSSEDNLLQWNESVLVNTDTNGQFLTTFKLTSNYIGTTNLTLRGSRGQVSTALPVTIVREPRVIDSVFTYSVIILVSIIYINFGCMLDWALLKQTLRRPIGPAIGFFCQFLFMPLISYGLGKLIFPDRYEMQLGMFFTGLSPAGGASNIWSVALDANVNLSVTMTTISTIAAFGMFPLWLFTLGAEIFSKAKMATPYENIAGYVFALVVPLGIGFLIQRYLPRVCRILVMLLKPFSVFLILFIIIFATVTNLYLFQIFTWKIAVAGLGLPWLGYFAGLLTAVLLRQPFKDVLAIAVETGVQNTGIAIFMLKGTLGQPAADLTTVIPVAVSIMTPIPLLILFIVLKLRNRKSSKAELLKVDDKTELNPTNHGNGNYVLYQ